MYKKAVLEEMRWESIFQLAERDQRVGLGNDRLGGSTRFGCLLIQRLCCYDRHGSLVACCCRAAGKQRDPHSPLGVRGGGKGPNRISTADEKYHPRTQDNTGVGRNEQFSAFMGHVIGWCRQREKMDWQEPP